MTNFYCDKCGMPILEDEHGDYMTGCQHYPLEELTKFNKKDHCIEITAFKLPEVEIHHPRPGNRGHRRFAI